MSAIRSQKGAHTVELGAALILVMPTIVFCVLATAEACQIYEINSVLNQVANTAARKLAIAYLQDPVTTMANPNSVLSKCTFLDIVRSTSQFSSPTNITGWNTSNSPPTVTVVVSFKSGQNGCPVFPNLDPLCLGKNLNFTATAVAPLE